LAFGWATLQLDAFLRYSPLPAYLSTIADVARGLSDSSAVDSGVISPCSFLVMMHMLMYLVDKMHFFVIICVQLPRFLWLYIWVVGSCFQYPSLPLSCPWCVFLPNSSSLVQLSIASESNGSGNIMQDPNSHGSSDAHPSDTIVFERTRTHNSTHSTASPRTSFASTLKLGLASHGSVTQSVPEPLFGSQPLGAI